ncbi:YggS family pyridoxal phosphate-dependent enzyme [Catenovulum sp. 2E275]|uniref:YggS family pyridoxal phosphate-dependent enzyme n=1 Tax=Catenovulum sp. 2E275 TaxID=2980497 RepID=UPI0021CEAE7D|nr:YggS family pyridoxal phosphate-dependent enzyme [Catenovulum sp. 2E275]MCU4674512.1 YggS family pyridoxal phosphate-dependent enzyme [Catenovulum sp. 2E275]
MSQYESSTIKSRLHLILSQIAQLNQTSQQSTQLLAVSKTKPATDIIEAYQAGQRCFGENYVQEAVDKIAELKQYQDIEWHFIGPIQSNKTRLIAENFDWVHSIDREKIASRLNEQRPAELAKLNVCLQINISQENSKSGTDIKQVFELAKYVSQQNNLCLRGIMAIPANTDDINQQKQSFAQMQQIFNQLKAEYDSVDTLSMGMTNDMALAIEYGSTMVRIGTAIFGARAAKNQDKN